MQWARDKKKRSSISNPSVVGVIYQLDYCLDFTDSQFTDILPECYDRMKEDLSKAGQPLPRNKDLDHDKHKDLILRELDCAVIEYLHQKIEEEIRGNPISELQAFDTVRGIFTEGGPAFVGGAIQKKEPYSGLYPESELHQRLLYSPQRGELALIYGKNESSVEN